MKQASVMLGLSLAILMGCSESGSTTAVTEPVSATTSGAAATASASGEEIYGEYCFSCHAAGISGAPKLGDKEAWAPRIAKGKALLLQATIEGVPPAMPPRGICMSCSDEDLAAAIDYMVAQSE